MEKLTLTINEASMALGIGRALCYQMAKEGRLPTVRLGKRLVVPVKALERMLEAGQAQEPVADGKPQ